MTAYPERAHPWGVLDRRQLSKLAWCPARSRDSRPACFSISFGVACSLLAFHPCHVSHLHLMNVQVMIEMHCVMERDYLILTNAVMLAVRPLHSVTTIGPAVPVNRTISLNPSR